MATEGLWVLVCAGSILVGNPPGPAAAAAEDPDGAIATTLAVQTAMQQGRDFLLHNNARAAVETLERQLPRINGNPYYLALMRDAYRAYIKELRLANQEAQAQRYSRFLAILETGASGDPLARAQAPAALAKAAAAAAPAPPPAAKAPTIRLKREEDDFFKSPAHPKAAAHQDALARAQQAFDKNDFAQASQLFAQAFQADRQLADASRDQWVYCRLHGVVERLNQLAPEFPTLEGEIRAALALNPAPRLDAYGKQLLHEIDDRRRVASAPRGAKLEPVTLRSVGRVGSWSVVETANFRIYHNQAPEYVQQAAEVCERTRSEMHRKWFGGTPEPWSPRCELYLHATGQDYSRETRTPAVSPGHSSFNVEGGRVLSRRIDLHCDVPDALVAVLPHEATHVVLAGNFGNFQVPRWADEGMAVLTEPREKIERHLRNLPKHAQDRQLFPLRQLVQMNNYPPPQLVGVFYAQSVSLVDFLSREKGPQVFTQFVRDGLRGGYDGALQRHYGYRSFEELERRWRAVALNEGTSQRYVQGTP